MEDFDISATCIAKSDQLNAEDLIHGTRTILVTGVRKVNDPAQPVFVDYESNNGKDYKPCLTMRRLLCVVWGRTPTSWIGKSMTLYCEEKVSFRKQKNIGGIRISHVSHIDRESVSVMLTVSRNVKKEFTVHRLKIEQPAKPILDDLDANQVQAIFLWLESGLNLKDILARFNSKYDISDHALIAITEMCNQ